MAFDDNHPGAYRYHAAIEQYKMDNFRKGKTQRWIAEDPTRTALVEAMFNSSNSFIQKMADIYGQWGQLTLNQEAAVRKVLAQAEERKAARIAESKAEAALSNFVGEEKKRQVWTLTLTFKTGFESDFGYVYIYGFKDEAGNIVIYKGSKFFEIEKGDKVTGKATVKAHNVRDGVNQTLISRPDFTKVVDMAVAA